MTLVDLKRFPIFDKLYYWIIRKYNFVNFRGQKKRGRKPMDPELKKKLQKERLQAKKDEKAKLREEKKSEKAAKKAGIEKRREERLNRKEKEEKEAKERRKPGRKGTIVGQCL